MDVAGHGANVTALSVPRSGPKKNTQEGCEDSWVRFLFLFLCQLSGTCPVLSEARQRVFSGGERCGFQALLLLILNCEWSRPLPRTLGGSGEANETTSLEALISPFNLVNQPEHHF